MLQEENIKFSDKCNPLSGLPHGHKGRKTNWDLASKYVPEKITKENLLSKCQNILNEL